MADNGVECYVVMEKTRFDTRETFPYFKLVFTNKGEKTVRLFDDFYPCLLYTSPCISEFPPSRNTESFPTWTNVNWI